MIAMSKKTFVAAIFISALLLSIVTGLQAAKLAKANPYGYLPSSPNKEPPTITVESISYFKNTSEVELSFVVTIPDSRNSSGHTQYNCYIYEIGCQLDNQSILALKDANYALIKDAQYNATNLTDLTVGQHIMQINVSSISLYNPPPAPNNWIDPCRYYSTLTQTIIFTVDAESNILPSYPLSSPTSTSYTTLSLLALDLGLQPTPTITTITATPTLSPSPTPSLTPPPSPTQQPSLIILVDSPQNKTYTTQYVPISISASDPTKHIGPESIAYSLDEGPLHIIAKIPVGAHSLNESTVLVLPDGSYNVVAVAITWFNGADGIFRSSPIYFTVNTSPPTPKGVWQETASLLIVATLVAIILIAITAFAVSRKRTRVYSYRSFEPSPV